MNVKTIASAAFAATMLASVVAKADVEFKPLEQDPKPSFSVSFRPNLPLTSKLSGSR